MTQEIRDQTLTGRGRFAYSTLGAATAGQAVAAAAQMSYAELMRTRLFEPLGMTQTYIQEPGNLVEPGRSRSGFPVQPWVMDAYAPGGGAVSTTGDLAKLATALVDGTAPGMVALDPTTATDESASRVGTFWLVSTSESGQTITWHGGETGGYAAYFGLDRLGHKAVIVLADVAVVARNLGTQLLTRRSSPAVSPAIRENGYF
jgi:CubicO group peptidase (beta-lactamase class C family)